jgi:hypothetical protein
MDDFLDLIYLDGWTVDFLCARIPGSKIVDGERWRSRQGVGSIETLLDMGTGRGGSGRRGPLPAADVEAIVGKLPEHREKRRQISIPAAFEQAIRRARKWESGDLQPSLRSHHHHH